MKSVKCVVDAYFASDAIMEYHHHENATLPPEIEADLSQGKHDSLHEHVQGMIKNYSVMKRVDVTLTGNTIVVDISFRTSRVEQVDSYHHSFTEIHIQIRRDPAGAAEEYRTTAEYKRDTIGGALINAPLEYTRGGKKPSNTMTRIPSAAREQPQTRAMTPRECQDLVLYTRQDAEPNQWTGKRRVRKIKGIPAKTPGQIYELVDYRTISLHPTDIPKGYKLSKYEKRSRDCGSKKLLRRPDAALTMHQGERYFTHDNGGRPFLLVIDRRGKRLRVYSRNDEEFHIVEDEQDWESQQHGKDEYERSLGWSYQHLEMDVAYEAVFLDEDGDTPGSSVLVCIRGERYAFVGNEIKHIRCERPIVEFRSPLGNADVPYPYAFDDEGKCYLFIEDVVASSIPQGVDPYAYYYDKPPGATFAPMPLAPRASSPARRARRTPRARS